MTTTVETIRAETIAAHGRASMAAIEAVSLDIRAAYRTGQRIKVTDAHGHTRTGTVSRSTGWAPVLLLMHRSNAHGSPDVLGRDDRIIARWNGRRYVPVED